MPTPSCDHANNLRVFILIQNIQTRQRKVKWCGKFVELFTSSRVPFTKKKRHLFISKGPPHFHLFILFMYSITHAQHRRLIPGTRVPPHHRLTLCRAICPKRPQILQESSLLIRQISPASQCISHLRHLTCVRI